MRCQHQNLGCHNSADNYIDKEETDRQHFFKIEYKQEWRKEKKKWKVMICFSRNLVPMSVKLCNHSDKFLRSKQYLHLGSLIFFLSRYIQDTNHVVS